jgi:phosphoenolpyruvate carboxykinase (GTP)
MWRNENDQALPQEIHHIVLPKTGTVPVTQGDFGRLPPKVQQFIAKWVETCTPASVHICDGSELEGEEITKKALKRGLLKKLDKLDNSYLARTDPGDVARVESKTFVCTEGMPSAP